MRRVDECPLSSKVKNLGSTHNDYLVLAALLLNFGVTLGTKWLVLSDFANSADEYAYQVSAQIMATGRFSVPSPDPPEFFTPVHVINDGKFYSKYPPGWPLVLSLGYRLGTPWLVNPVLGVLTVAWLYVIARKHFTQTCANIVLLLASTNPFMIFNSASYHSHPSCLFFSAICVGAYLSATEGRPRVLDLLLMGTSAGASFLVRPYTALCLLGPLGLHFFAHHIWTGNTRLILKKSWAAVLPFAALLAFFFYYNFTLTGNPFLQPFTKYQPSDGPKLALSAAEFKWAVVHNLLDRLVDINLWVPLCLILAAVALFHRSQPLDQRVSILIACAASLLVGYFFYLCDGGFRYGPRYAYEAVCALLLVSASAISHMSRLRLLTLVACLAMSAITYIRAANYHSLEVQRRSSIFSLVKEQGITNAIVFLESGAEQMRPGDLVRNGIDFQRPILYVLDLGPHNNVLLDMHPHRAAYFYSFDEKLKKSRLLKLR
jgi:4-amino-4-deoxy-L-arabinose transferase-like glycosyltransferase